MNRKLKICVIGGGIFGLTTAIYLSKYSKIIKIFDRNSYILNGATRYNHNRHHYGFHYPRSLETAYQCLDAKKDFHKYYQNCIDYYFQNIYAISKDNSKISYHKFENFCKKAFLKLSNIDIPTTIFHPEKISKCYVVNEGVYNFFKIKSAIIKRVVNSKNIKIIKNININSFVDQNKFIEYLSGNKLIKEDFDLIINATYDGINSHILKTKNKINMEYNLQEMCKLKINSKRFGSTILDGEFPSILPIAGKRNEYLFAHVKYSQLFKKISKNIPIEILNKKIPSQIKKTIKKSEEYLKVLNDSKIIGSFRVIRAVKVDKENDSRKSEIICHSNGNFSIFSGKIITVEKIAKDLSKLVNHKY